MLSEDNKLIYPTEPTDIVRGRHQKQQLMQDLRIDLRITTVLAKTTADC